MERGIARIYNFKMAPLNSFDPCKSVFISVICGEVWVFCKATPNYRMQTNGPKRALEDWNPHSEAVRNERQKMPRHCPDLYVFFNRPDTPWHCAPLQRH